MMTGLRGYKMLFEISEMAFSKIMIPQKLVKFKERKMNNLNRKHKN